MKPDTGAHSKDFSIDIFKTGGVIMSYISCSVSSCANNKSGTCYAAGLNIGGKGATSECETCCGSYLNSAVYSNLANFTSMRGEANYILCSANTCKHNSGGACSLNSIEVGSATNTKYYTETECMSFEQ